MSQTSRAEARKKGLRIAARIAAVSGLALAAAGIAEARAAETETRTTNDAAPLPLEDLVKVHGVSGCGCAPCWGPPAPPKRTRRRRRARRGAR